MKKILLTLLTIGFVGILAQAQTWDDSGDSWDDSGDSWDDSGDSWDDGSTSSDYDYDAGAGSGTVGDSASNDDWGGDDWGSDGGFDYGGGQDEYVRSARPKVESKPYERFTGMPYDSAAELITFVEIVEVIVPDRFLDLGGEDYSVSDSLYERARSWMAQQFGEKEAKKMIEEAGEDLQGREGKTIQAIVVMPLVVERNKFAKSTAGVIQFDMEIRFKDERYRYKFNNFVHVEPNFAGGKDEVRTYMEYYMT
ncbi:MAG: DUF4468 domain-containing protein, partial [Bacteroidia bacterium]|nr:DUF4468 domain-containing protein [Bacteroidia bacterium]NNJ55905.1 DUF4468 domain-containing protein [Bacteroidia bacterium]